MIPALQDMRYRCAKSQALGCPRAPNCCGTRGLFAPSFRDLSHDTPLCTSSTLCGWAGKLLQADSELHYIVVRVFLSTAEISIFGVPSGR